MKELVPDGAHKSVTKDNHIDYCNLYVGYFLNDAIKEQFKAFKEGFMRVCPEKILVRGIPRGMCCSQKKCGQYVGGLEAFHPICNSDPP